MKDFFYNLFYRLRYWRTYIFNRNKFNSKFSEIQFYGAETILFDDFESVDYNRWRVGHGWGVIHPDQPGAYYSQHGVTVGGGSGHLELSVKYRPATLYTDGGYISSNYAVGYLSLKNPFKLGYGYFEIRCKLPKNKGAWPAFWLTGCDTWPPEIDMFEFYGRNGCGQINRQEIRHHWRKPNRRYNTRFKFNLRHKFDLTEEFHIYGCLWTPSGIYHYFDGLLIAQHTKQKVLTEYFNNQSMYLVVNNNLHPEDVDLFDEVEDSRFIVDYVRVDQFTKIEEKTYEKI